jgi:hypothetical protein
MEKEFVTYEIALDLKELGFDESCFGWHAGENHCNLRQVHSQPNHPDNLYNWCSAPTFSQAFRWFREKYDIDSSINKQRNHQYYCISLDLNGLPASDDLFSVEFTLFDTYTEAELACLKKLIEIVKEK